MFGLAAGVLRRKFAAGSKESVSMVVLFPLDKALSHPQGLHVQMMYRVRERERKNFTQRKKKKKEKKLKQSGTHTRELLAANNTTRNACGESRQAGQASHASALIKHASRESI